MQYTPVPAIDLVRDVSQMASWQAFFSRLRTLERHYPTLWEHFTSLAKAYTVKKWRLLRPNTVAFPSAMCGLPAY